jgi:DNA-binding CsgD family transcriptional regulator/tetratricopeptide (TPR) repeat protein
MILCTARESELTLDHPTTRSLGEIVKLPSFRRILLDGLEPSEVHLYLRGALGQHTTRDLAEELHRRSGGNPLFVIELARAARSLHPASDEDSPVPSGIREAIGRRLARLPVECRSVLSLASVIGRSFEAAVLRRLVAVRGRARLQALLQIAADQGFVEQVAAGTTWRFTHALVQEVLHDALPADHRAEVHARIADALEAVHGSVPGPHLDDLFRHRLGASPIRGAEGVARAAAMCVERAREKCAPELAVRVLEPALEAVRAAARTIARKRDEAALLHLLGKALDDLGDPRSMSVLESSFDLYAELGDARSAIDVALTPSHYRGAIGTLELTIYGTVVPTRRKEALALARRDPRSRLRLLAGWWDPRELRRAIAQARRREERDIELLALMRLACKVDDEDYGTAAPLWAQAMRHRHRCHDVLLLHYLLYWNVDPRAALGDLEGARVNAREMLENAERARSRRFLWEALQTAAMVEASGGEWEAARRHIAAVFATPSNDQPVMSRIFCLIYLATVEAETGNKEALAACERDLGGLAGKPGLTFPLLAARLACISGDLDDLEAVTREAPEPGPSMSPAGWFEIAWHVARATLAILRGNRGVAASLEEYFRARKGLYLLPWPGGRCCDGVLGQLCECGGKLDEAIEHFEDALAFCRRSGYRPELAWTYRYAGQALLRRSRPGDALRATRLLDEGVALARSLGMKPLISQIQVLRRSLHTGAPPVSSQLSARELEVVRLVAGGLTNREIGVKLAISEHTAAKHVQNILVKTGMSNRAEVSAFAASRGLLEG